MIAYAALVATLRVRSAESRGTVLLLSWIVPYLLVTGAFQVKFTRYLIPVTPLLVLFGAQMLFHLWEWVASYRRWLRHVVAAVMIALVTATCLYALAYMGIYQVPHTAIRSSEWLNQNATADSVILMEQLGGGYPETWGDMKSPDYRCTKRIRRTSSTGWPPNSPGPITFSSTATGCTAPSHACRKGTPSRRPTTGCSSEGNSDTNLRMSRRPTRTLQA